MDPGYAVTTTVTAGLRRVFPGSGRVSGRAAAWTGKRPVTLQRVGSESRREYGCGTERTSHAVTVSASPSGNG